MKVLLCGAGRMAREVLRRMSDTWRVTLVDLNEDKLNQSVQNIDCIVKIVSGDASSPLILKEASLEEQDYVLALTNSDEVNLVIAQVAREKGIKHVVALVYDPKNFPLFQKLGVKTISTTLLARNIFHYLQDPRLDITPIAHGLGELMEVDVSSHMWLVNNTVENFENDKWRVAAILRQGKLIFAEPQTIIQAEDRLIILGVADLFEPICSLLDCLSPYFPLKYGQGLLMVLPDQKKYNCYQIFKESLHLIQKIKIKHMRLLCVNPQEHPLQEEVQKWSQSLDIEVRQLEANNPVQIQKYCTQDKIGIVVLSNLETAFVHSVTQPTLISLAHLLPCPVLVSKGSIPYRRILVPFNGTPQSELALESAMDLAKQIQSEVTVALVKEPDFLHSSEEKDWAQKNIEKAWELAHIHKSKLGEVVREGNPVKELVDLAKDYDLLVVGSRQKKKKFFTPHVGELLVRQSPCSVLIITR